MTKTERKKKRDRRLIEKFHELYDVKRNRIDDVLKELADEHFFLDEDYIYSRIFYCKENHAYYNVLLEASNSK